MVWDGREREHDGDAVEGGGREVASRERGRRREMSRWVGERGSRGCRGRRGGERKRGERGSRWMCGSDFITFKKIKGCDWFLVFSLNLVSI